MNTLLADKKFYSTMFRIAIPIIIQNFVSFFVNAVDVFMVGQLGETSIAALGLSNQIFAVLSFLLFGISSGSAIFTAQFWGDKDIKGIRRVLGICLTVATSGAILFSILAIFFPETALRVFSKDPKVITLGSDYLRIVGLSYIPTAITICYSSILKSVENVKLPMFITTGALVTNTILSYSLIFGKFGMPAMGVKGAAIATCIARLAECVVLLSFIYIRKYPIAAKLKEMIDFNTEFLRKFFKTALPVFFNEIIWSLGITTYNIIYARLGTESTAAVSICATIEGMAFVLFIGMSHACAIMIGNRIGAKEEHIAFDYGKKFLILTIAGSLVVGFILFLNSKNILANYKLSETAFQYAYYILIITSFAMWIKTSNMMLLVGIIRSGGDTRFSFILDVTTIWFVGIPVAFIGAFVFHLPTYMVILLVLSDELIKLIIGIKRFTSRKWINNLVT